MKTYKIYERVYLNWGKPFQDEFRGYVEARDAKSALNKAKRQLKVERHGGEYGAFARRIKTENLFIGR